jgi:hypothetical protein|tara:strand:- start:2180 stop:2359 length:180 start_codon:yes stop_codon:yes gene_type:complete
MNTQTTLSRDQKINFILAARGIAKLSEFGKYVLDEYSKMLDDELNIEFEFYVTDFNSMS